MNWRINYGNGQVHEVSSKKVAFSELASLTQYKAFAFIQRRDQDGEWVRVR